MTQDTWDRTIHSLVMIRLGQELGTSSESAQAITGIVDMLVSVLGRILG